MRKLALNLGERSYNIFIGEKLLTEDSGLKNYCAGEKVLILSNEAIAPFYLETVKSSLTGKKVYQFLIPDGETHKNLLNFSEILDFLIENSFRRNDTLIALGGGVVGDLGGFVAASYQRGMGFIQVPTSLLAQVDSSVGGKTAVNHPSGKNLIGAFYQPLAVFIDTNTLASLPQKEFVSGLAEIAKYAMLGELNIKHLLLSHSVEVLARDSDVLSKLIFHSCAKKAEVVTEDEKEKGSRALLNLGHTFGHAIEKVTGYQQYLHGEAVSIGIHMAINLSLAKKLISENVAIQYKQLLNCLGLPDKVNLPLSVKEIMNAMKVDKKNINDKYRLVLPNDTQCVIVEEDDMELVREAIDLQLKKQG